MRDRPLGSVRWAIRRIVSVITLAVFFLMARPAAAADPSPRANSVASTDAGRAAVTGAGVDPGRVVYYVHPTGRLPDWLDKSAFEVGIVAVLGPSAISGEGMVGEANGIDLVEGGQRADLRQALATLHFQYLVFLELLPKDDRLDVFVYVYDLANPSQHPRQTSISMDAPVVMDTTEAERIERERQAEEARLLEAARVAEEQRKADEAWAEAERQFIAERRDAKAREVEEERRQEEERSANVERQRARDEAEAQASARQTEAGERATRRANRSTSEGPNWKHQHVALRLGVITGRLIGEDVTYEADTTAGDNADQEELAKVAIAETYADADVSSANLGAAATAVGGSGGVDAQLGAFRVALDFAIIPAMSDTIRARGDTGTFDVHRTTAGTVALEAGIGVPLGRFIPYACARAGLYIGLADASADEGAFAMTASGGVFGGSVGVDYLTEVLGVGVRVFADTGNATIIGGGIHVLLGVSE